MNYLFWLPNSVGDCDVTTRLQLVRMRLIDPFSLQVPISIYY